MNGFAPNFDHGAALRVPSASDVRGWSVLMAWLGRAGKRLASADAVEVRTATGRCIASAGDWIVLSVTGEYHVAAGRLALHG